MRSRIPLALLVALAMLVAACGGGGSGADTTESTDTTEPTGTTEDMTSTTEAMTTTTGGEMDLAFDAGFDEATGTITLGALAALTGPIPDIGASLLHGHELYWDALNGDEGGVAGMYPVELIVRDNEYNPEVNPVVYNEIKDDVLAISSSLGTPTTATIFEAAAAENILVAAGSLASQWALTDNVPLNLAAGTYFSQFANAPYWATEIADPAVITEDSVIGMIYQADDYGEDCLNGLNVGLENTGLELSYEATYAATDTDFSAQIGGAQAAGVDVLFVCALPTALATMLGTAGAIEYSPTVLGSSPSYNVALPAALGQGDEVAGIGFFSSFPYYGLGAGPSFEDDTPGMTKMRESLEAYGADIPDQELNAFFWFGYAQAQTFHQILEAGVANGDITRAGLLGVIPTIQDFDPGFGGDPTGYGPTPKDKIPTNEDNIGVPVSLSERVFGLDPVSDFFVAPYMADWDPAG